MPDAAPPQARPQEHGFTLLEILIVVAILGLLIGLVAPAALRQLGGARVSVARQSVERIGSVLDLYKLDVGRYPVTDEGLPALIVAPAGAENWNGPYVKRNTNLIDPWGHVFNYRSPGQHGEFDLFSYGPNSGNADDATPAISNW